MKRKSPGIRVIIAGGGTGGHLFPGIAIAREILARDPENRVLFVGAGNPFEKRILKSLSLSHEIIRSSGIKGKRLPARIRSILLLLPATFKSILLFKRFMPDLVLSMGGYSAAPVMVAAKIAGIKRALHEQNAVPGLTNRLLSGISNRNYLTVPLKKGFSLKGESVILGNPVREEIKDASGLVPKKKGFTLLFLGGSQGAHRLNTEGAKAAKLASEKIRCRIIHQTGKADEDSVSSFYSRNGMDATVKAFFPDIWRWMVEADIVICRAGATTIAELTSLGKFAIYIPYPYAADDHQTANANRCAKAGAGEIIAEKDLNPAGLAKRIIYYAKNPEILKRGSQKAAELGKPDAAQRIVDDLYRLAEPGTKRLKTNVS